MISSSHDILHSIIDETSRWAHTKVPASARYDEVNRCLHSHLVEEYWCCMAQSSFYTKWASRSRAPPLPLQVTFGGQSQTRKLHPEDPGALDTPNFAGKRDGFLKLHQVARRGRIHRRAREEKLSGVAPFRPRLTAMNRATSLGFALEITVEVSDESRRLTRFAIDCSLRSKAWSYYSWP